MTLWRTWRRKERLYQLDRQDELGDLYQQKQALQDLLRHQGYQLVKNLVETQCRLRRVQVFSTQMKGLESCFEVATLQGEVAGLQMLVRLPELMIADLESSIVARVGEEEEKENESTR